MTGDTFTKDRFTWLDGVLEDRALTPSTFKIAYLIAARHLNRNEGTAWPSYRKLADAIGVSEKSAMRAVAELVERGHLEVTQRGNIGKSNIYKLKIGTTVAAVGCQAVTPDNLVTPDIPVTPYIPVTPATLVPHPLTELSLSPGQDCPPNPLMEPIEENPKEETYPPASEIVVSAPADVSSPPDWKQSFKEFWKQYPRKKGGPGAAEKAYKSALEKASAETILAGCLRFSAEKHEAYANGEKPQYTPYASTWLNRRSWEDEPDPVVSPVNRPAVTNADRKTATCDIRQRLNDIADMVSGDDRATVDIEAPIMRMIG